MKKIVNKIVYALLCISALIITTCTVEENIVEWVNPEGGNVAEITLLAEMPSIVQAPTKGTGSIPENTIENVYVLVFDKTTGELVAKSPGKSLTVVPGSPNNNKVSFKATLPVGVEYTFMILTNTGDKLSGIEPGKYKSDILALTVTQTGKWDAAATRIPMWAEKDLTLTGSSSPSFDLTRMLARVNLEVNLAEVIPGTPRDNFKLTSIRYYNFNTTGTLAPEADNYDFANKQIIRPTLPASTGTQTGSALLYTGTDITDEQSCREKIYIFEAAHNNSTYNNPTDNTEWINNPCLVIGGHYKTDNDIWLGETFYRIDFIKKDDMDPDNVKDIWLSILRNFSYNVTITGVNGSGFPDPDIALKSAPINMEANILVWNESDMGDIVFDGVFFLSVSRDKLSVVSSEVDEEKEENRLYIKTDYTFNNDPNDSSSGWYVEKYVDKDTDDPVTWLKLNPERAAPDRDNPVKAWFTFEENDWEEPRTAIVWIAAGRLRYPVEVTQRLGWIEIVDPLNGDSPLTELRFEVLAGGEPVETKPFKVNWSPSGETVSIEQHSPRSWAPFDPANIVPDPSILWNLTGTGEETYYVTGPAVTQQFIDEDPFYEKESVYTFTVGSGENAQSASISLHQIHYKIIVDTHDYKLDGGRYYLTVRSNTEWEITDIEEWLYDEAPGLSQPGSPIFLDNKDGDNLTVGTTGGPNTDGTILSFSLIDRLKDDYSNRWGTIYVTFKSPDNKFPQERVPLTFLQNKKRFLLLTLGYSREIYRVYTLAPYSAHDNTPYNMLRAQANFGESPESTVHVRQMDIRGYNVEGVSGGAWTTADLRSWMDLEPDILVVSYSMILNEEESQIITNYINSGGVAIILVGGYNDESGNGHSYGASGAQMFLRTFLEDPDIITTKLTAGEGDVYKFPDGDQWMKNPVLYGPFGDLRGKHWGAHARSVGFKTNNTATYDQIEIFNRSQDNVGYLMGGSFSNPYPSNKTDHVVGFKHKTKNMIWIGCDTFMGANHRGYLPNRHYDAFTIDDQFRPIPRVGFASSVHPGDVSYTVYNSQAVANMLAWAISVIPDSE